MKMAVFGGKLPRNYPEPAHIVPKRHLLPRNATLRSGGNDVTRSSLRVVFPLRVTYPRPNTSSTTVQNNTPSKITSHTPALLSASVEAGAGVLPGGGDAHISRRVRTPRFSSASRRFFRRRLACRLLLPSYLMRPELPELQLP